MNIQLRDRLSFCFSIALGLGISTGHPAGLVAATAMPVACFAPGTRRAAFQCAFGYYIAVLWPVVPGFERYFEHSTLFIPLAIWLGAAILLSIPWTIAWTPDRLHFVWRAPLALVATVVPPLGIIGLASPLTGAGYLLPGASWAGLAVVTLLPGIVLSSQVWALRPRWFVRCLAIGLCLGLAVSAPPDAQPPQDWVAVNTHFGDVSQPFRDFAAAQFIQQRAAATPARVLIFPESVVPRWSQATEAFWHNSLESCRTRGKILVIGAGLPAAIGKDAAEKLRDLKAYDFGAAIDALKGKDEPVRWNAPSKPSPKPINNAILAVGAESATFYQRVPVPFGMWQPFNKKSVPLRLGGPGVLLIDHQRAAALICYEQMLTFPILASMPQHPTVIVGISNTFWVANTTIPRYQASAVRAWAKLFRLPYFLAVNS